MKFFDTLSEFIFSEKNRLKEANFIRKYLHLLSSSGFEFERWMSNRSWNSSIRLISLQIKEKGLWLFFSSLLMHNLTNIAAGSSTFYSSSFLRFSHWGECLLIWQTDLGENPIQLIFKGCLKCSFKSRLNHIKNWEKFVYLKPHNRLCSTQDAFNLIWTGFHHINGEAGLNLVHAVPNVPSYILNCIKFS